MSKTGPGPRETNTPKLALVMVGLPARGKTFLSRKLARYLSWLGYDTRVFNVGSYRRARVGSRQDHEFFNDANPEGRAARRMVAMMALDDMLGWLGQGGDVGIYDATNSTHERRQFVRERCQSEGLQVVFIESICNDLETIGANVRATKLRSPDYANMAPEEAVRDFRARIAHYERAYETLGDDDGSYVKLIDVGRQIVINKILGYLPARIVVFLMNLHITPRPIWLTRHGESTFNLVSRIGGDPVLSPRGEQYAVALSRFVAEQLPSEGELTIWTSGLRRAIDTAKSLGQPFTSFRALNEIDAGACDGMTYSQIQSDMASEFAARAADKFHYRYPLGESYQDVIERLDPVIIELERQRNPVLVIGHQAVLRALYAYLIDRPPNECPHLSIPLHTVIELTADAYGWEERRFMPQMP